MEEATKSGLVSLDSDALLEDALKFDRCVKAVQEASGQAGEFPSPGQEAKWQALIHRAFATCCEKGVIHAAQMQVAGHDAATIRREIYVACKVLKTNKLKEKDTMPQCLYKWVYASCTKRD